MKAKFTDARKTFIIRKGEDATPVEEICRMAWISDQPGDQLQLEEEIP
jgi:hypothetical protein